MLLVYGSVGLNITLLFKFTVNNLIYTTEKLSVSLNRSVSRVLPLGRWRDSGVTGFGDVVLVAGRNRTLIIAP